MKSPFVVVLSLVMAFAMASCSSKRAKHSDENADMGTEDLVLESEGSAGMTDSVPEEGTEFEKMADQAMKDGSDKVVDQLPLDEQPKEAPVEAKAEQPPVQEAAATPEPAPIASPYDAPKETLAAAPVATVGSGNYEDYHVQNSDTLMKIAYDVYGNLYDWKKIYEANQDRIKDPNRIPAGTVLKVEKPSAPVATQQNGDKYLIKEGDTLGTISYDIYGTEKKWKRLWENNQQLIRDPNKIFAGFYLYYTITPEERNESEKLKQEHGIEQPKPLAKKDKKVIKREAASVMDPSPSAPAPERKVSEAPAAKPQPSGGSADIELE